MRRLDLPRHLILGALVAFAIPWLIQGMERNLAFLMLSKVFGAAVREHDAEVFLRARDVQPYAAYGLGLLMERIGAQVEAETSWARAIQGDSRYLVLLWIRANRITWLAQVATQTFPTSDKAWEWLGDAEAEARPNTAIDHYLLAARLNPRNNLAWEKTGILADKAGDWGLALAAYRRACDLNPRRNWSCLSAGRLAFAEGDWQTTIYYYERGGYPESIEGWVELIRAATNVGHTEAAARYLSQAQTEYPADYEKLLQAIPG